MKGKDLQPRLLCSVNLSFRMEGQIKCFPYKVKLKEFIIAKLLCNMKCYRGLKKKKIKTMNSKMTTNSQLSTTELKRIKERKARKTKTKQTTRTGTESEKWTSHGGFSVGGAREKWRGEGTGKKKHNWKH